MVNVLTIPLSPMGGGMMSEKQYTPLMYVKVGVIGILAFLTLTVWLWNRIILKEQERMRNQP